MKKIIYSFLTMFCAIIFAQVAHTQTEYTSLVPNAPETAAIGEYIDSPMNEYSGLPSINIPLTSISDDGINVPVSISYHAGGIRVAEEATRVGLGWSLSTSGVITREIRDKDDFGFLPTNLNVLEEPLNGYVPGFVTAYFESDNENAYGYFPEGTNFAWVNWIEAISSGYQTINSTVFGYDAELEHYTGVDGNSYSAGDVFCDLHETDTQSDIYKFSFLGNSGSFVMDHHGNFVCLDNHNIKIELDESNQYWILTDEYGTRFTFGMSDNGRQRTFSQSYDFKQPINNFGTFQYVEFESNTPPITNHISSWHLEKIESVQGGEITFIYLKDAKGINALPSATEKITKKIKECNINISGHGFDETTLINTHYLFLNKTTYDDVRLQSITNTKDQEIVFFEDSQDRIDLLGSRALKSIQSKTNGNVAKSIIFIQSNLIADENSPNLWTSKINAQNPEDIYEDVIGDNEFARLRLDEVVIQGGGESLPPYQFSYNEDALPPKTSFSTDHWGYYNGAMNNTFLPYIRINEVTNFGFSVCDDNFSLVFDFANKDSDEDKSKFGILESITSPTGFVQSFDYELHSFQNLNDEKISFSPQICDEVEFQFRVTHNSPDEAFIIESFVIPEDYIGLLNLQIDGNGFLDNDHPCADASLAFVANIEFENLANGNIINIPINGNDNYEIDSEGNFSFFKDKDIEIEPGEYKLTLISHCIQLFPVDSNVEMHAKISKLCDTNQGAGLRVNKITNYDGVNNTIEKVYDYKNSGNCNSYMTYGKKYILQLKGGSIASSKLGSMFDLSSNSHVPFSNPFSSQLVGYGRVEKTYNSQGEMYGSQESYYHVEMSIINPKARFGLFQTARFSSSRNGMLDSQFVRDFANNVINKKTYTYDNFWLDFDWIWSFKVQPWVLLVDNIGTPECSEDLLISSHAFIPQWHKLISVTEEKYGSEGGEPLTITTDYQYNDKNYRTRRETITDSEISKTIDYEYAHDLQDQLLLDANMVGVLLSTKVNDGAGGGSQVNYKAQGEHILPHEYFTIGSDGTMSKLLNTLYYNYTDQYPDSIRSRAKAHVDRVTWGGTGKRGLIRTIRNKDRISTFKYDDFRNINNIETYNGITSTWMYDGLQRMDESTSNNDRLKNTITYTYGLQGGGENSIRNEMDNSDGTGYNTETIFDGMGRSLMTTKEAYLGSGTDYISEVEYGPLGNVVSKTVPEEGGTTTYTYELSPLRRILTTEPAGSTKTIETRHKIEENNLVIETTDENGNTTKSFTDIFGRQTKTVDALGNTALYTYNDRDQILTIQPPLGAPYVYTYYNDGLLWTKTIPDKGTFTYTYNDHDQLETEQLPNGGLLRYTYDEDYNDFLKSVSVNGTIIKEYDFYDASKRKDWIGTEKIAIFDPAGGLSAAKHEVEFDYDEYGMDFGVPTWVSTSTLGGDFNEEYTFDNMGNMLENVKTIKGPGPTINILSTSDFQKGIRRESNWTAVDDIGLGTKEFKYNDNDWLEHAILGQNMQKIDYSYNPRGWLTGINSIDDTYLNEDPCFVDEFIPDDIDCDKLINVIQSYLIKFNCSDIQDDKATGLKITKKVQYFEGEGVVQAATINEYFIPINGGLDDGSIQFTNSFNFDLNSGLGSSDITTGILEQLIDCILNNPELLGILNNEIMTILGGDQGGTNPELPLSTNNNEDVFGMEIHYTEGNGELNAPPQYNGNISWMEWRSKTDQRHAYGFRYDPNNRLNNAFYGEVTNYKECKIKKTDKYSVPIIQYDALGNILVLHRRGLTGYNDINMAPTYGAIDVLSYNYESGSSLLRSVNNASSSTNGFQGPSSSYSYKFGNLKSDSQKGIDKIIYTYNDLPLSIQTADGDIKNWYTADGLKVQSEIDNPESITKRNYLGGAEYVDDIIESVYVEEGRVSYTEDGQVYPEYYLKDHLGNVRVRIADKNLDNLVKVDPNDPENDELMNIRHYYPFGMQWDTPSKDQFGNSLEPTGVKNAYTYNGKEFLNELDINLHDYGFRYYDPAIARFTTVDPMADQRSWVSTFNYVQNNPILRIDPNGALDSPIYGEDGKFLGTDSEGFTGDIVVMNEYVYSRLTNGGEKTLDHSMTTALVENTTVANNIGDASLSAEAASNILTDVVLKTEGVNFDRLEGGIINTIDTPIDEDGDMGYVNGDTHGNAKNIPLSAEAAAMTNNDGSINVTTRLLGGASQFKTVEHAQNVLGVHEYQGHGIKNYSGSPRGERQANQLQTKHPTFKKLTPSQQKLILNRSN